VADQLAIVARLIKGNLGSHVYRVELDGFDTHAEQTPRLTDLFGQMNAAVKAFFDDLTVSGDQNKVLMSTFSEFSRRVKENGSLGTDHGSAGPLMLFGAPGALKHGFHGSDPDLVNTDDTGNIVPTTDFRDIYATLLTGWLGIDCSVVEQTLDYQFDIVDLIEDPELPGYCAPLPVELSAFAGTVLRNTITLEWTTLSESNSSGFSVQESSFVEDGGWTEWNEIGFVNSIGNSDATQNYEYVREQLEPGTYRFRLRQIDFDGTSVTSDFVQLNVAVPKSFFASDIYPNPVRDNAQLTIVSAQEQRLKVDLYDEAGRRVKRVLSKVLRSGVTTRVSIDASSLPSGDYLAVIQSESHKSTKKFVVIQ